MTPNQRKSAPALYELVGSGRPRADASSVRPREVKPDAVDNEPQPTPRPQAQERTVPAGAIEGEFSPGGSVRMPAGVVFFIVFGLFAAIFAGYLIGYQQKAREVENEMGKAAVQNLDLPEDPLNAGPVNPNLVRDEQTARNLDGDSGSQRPVAGEGATEGRPVPENPRSTGAVTLIVEGDMPDPREKGLNYFAMTSMGAERVQAFLDHLAANRVDAAAYRVNDGVYRIYALRGFSREQYRDDRAPFEDAIKAITERFRDDTGRGVTYKPFWEKF